MAISGVRAVGLGVVINAWNAIVAGIDDGNMAISVIVWVGRIRDQPIGSTRRCSKLRKSLEIVFC